MLLYLDELLETKKTTTGGGQEMMHGESVPLGGGDYHLNHPINHHDNHHYQPLQNDRMNSIGSDGELERVSYSDADAEGITLMSEDGETMLAPETFNNQQNQKIPLKNIHQFKEQKKRNEQFQQEEEEDDQHEAQQQQRQESLFDSHIPGHEGTESQSPSPCLSGGSGKRRRSTKQSLIPRPVSRSTSRGERRHSDDVTLHLTPNDDVTAFHLTSLNDDDVDKELTRKESAGSCNSDSSGEFMFIFLSMVNISRIISYRSRG